jgi:hypothetical protein
MGGKKESWEQPLPKGTTITTSVTVPTGIYILMTVGFILALVGLFFLMRPLIC